MDRRLASLPRLGRAVSNAKQRVRADLGDGRKALELRRCAKHHLGTQVRQLELELAARNAEATAVPDRADARAVEVVATQFGFRSDRGEIMVDRGKRGGVGAETVQLRVVAVAAGLPAQHCPRKEALAPDCDETLTVEIRRMNAPQSHACKCGTGHHSSANSRRERCSVRSRGRSGLLRR